MQNTPGGGWGGLGGLVGSGQGGTSVAAGGAGAGAGGLVVSTLGSGPVIASFDPTITGTFQVDHLGIDCTSLFCGPHQNTTTGNFAYNQGFTWGTNMTVGFNNTRVTSDNPFNAFTPVLNSSFQLRLSQHLLQGFGFYSQRSATSASPRTIASFRMSLSACKRSPRSTRSKTCIGIWSTPTKMCCVQQESLAFAQKTFSDTKKQVEIGTLAPIEVVRAQSTVASDQQTLTLRSPIFSFSNCS